MKDSFIRNRDGEVIKRSRNLRGFLEHIRTNLVKCVQLTELPHGSALLIVDFDNGDYLNTDWASFEVLKYWIANRLNLQGAPLVINGEDCGKVERHNPKLKGLH